jgi:hypothetical protein
LYQRVHARVDWNMPLELYQPAVFTATFNFKPKGYD